MAHYIRRAQETMEIADPHDTMIPTDEIKVTNETAHDRLIISRDTSHEVLFDSETTHEIVLIAHAQQVVLASVTDIHVE